MFSQERIERAAKEAEASFWQMVAELFPEIETGELDPETCSRFLIDCEKVIKAWLDQNDEINFDATDPDTHGSGCTCYWCTGGRFNHAPIKRCSKDATIISEGWSDACSECGRSIEHGICPTRL